MSPNTKKIMIITLVAVFSMSTLALAGWGRGYGRMMGSDERGPGWRRGGGYGYCQGWNSGNLSKEDLLKLDQMRSDFYKSTESIRQKLYEKRLALRSEMAKTKPDTGKASSLQKDISKLRSDLDQKQLDFEIKIKKAFPDYQSGYRGYGPRMGHGPRGGGYCVR